MLDAGVIAAALAGLTGSLHCLGMCSGYVAMAGGRRGQDGAQPLLPARELRIGQAATQLGRLSTYTLLGAALGAAGGAAFALQWPLAQRALYAFANLVLLLTAVRMARPSLAAPVLERAGLALFRHATPLARPFVAGRGIASRYVLGLLWGLTPCALIYGLLPVALLSGSAFAGASVMLGLWLGTLPALLLASRAVARLASARNRLVAAGVVGLFALAGLYRVLFVPGLPGAGPFCLTP